MNEHRLIERLVLCRTHSPLGLLAPCGMRHAACVSLLSKYRHVDRHPRIAQECRIGTTGVLSETHLESGGTDVVRDCAHAHTRVRLNGSLATPSSRPLTLRGRRTATRHNDRLLPLEAVHLLIDIRVGATRDAPPRQPWRPDCLSPASRWPRRSPSVARTADCVA